MTESMKWGSRRTLPARRRSFTQKIRVDGNTIHYTVGLYEDGSPGEIFIDASKEGTAMRYWMGHFAMMMSMALQHGAPLETLIANLEGSRCDPCGRVECHETIHVCTSVMDAIARDLRERYANRTPEVATVATSG